MKKIILILLFSLFSQSRAENIDSLLKEFNTGIANDTVSSQTYRIAGNIGELLANEDINRGSKFAFEVKTLAVENDDNKFHQIAHVILAHIFKNTGNYDKALENYLFSSSIAKTYDIAGYAWALTMTGNLYYERKLYLDAEDYYKRSREVFRTINLRSDSALGEDSLNYYDGQAVALNNIALVRKAHQKYDEALELNKAAYKYRDSADNAIGKAYYHFYVADILRIKHNFDNAKKHLVRAAGLLDSLLSVKLSEHSIYNAKALIFEEYAQIAADKKEPVLARKMYSKAIDEYKKNNNISGEISIFLSISGMYSDFGDFSKSVNAANKALELSEKYNSHKLKESSLKNLAMLYQKYNNPKMANEFFTAHLNFRDSLKKVYDSNSFQLIEKNFITEQKIQNIEKIKQQQKIQEVKLKRQKLFILLLAGLFLLSLIAAIISVRSYNFKKKTNKILSNKNEELSKTNTKLIESREELSNNYTQLHNSERKLKELNATKDKFFSIIAHDLKNPIGTLKNALEVLTMMYNKFSDREKFEYIKELNASTKSLYSLLENLLTWSRSQNDKIIYNPEKLDIDMLTNNVLQTQKLHIEKKKIQIEINIDKQNCIAFADPNMLSTVIRNLLSNAVKFTPTGGNIALNSYISNGELIFSVSDTGIGIPPDKTEELFRIDMNYSTPGTNNEKGTGLGLILCKEFIVKNKGRIWVKSEEGKGSTFYVAIPAFSGKNSKMKLEENYKF